MIVLLVAAFGDRGVPAEVPLVEWPDVVVLVGDDAVHRHRVVDEYCAQQVLLESPCAFTPDLAAPRATGLVKINQRASDRCPVGTPARRGIGAAAPGIPSGCGR